MIYTSTVICVCNSHIDAADNFSLHSQASIIHKFNNEEQINLAINFEESDNKITLYMEMTQ